MNELKTLKDLIDECGDLEEDWIRKAAIEWVKADKSNFYSRKGMEETKEWIKHFFNITKEDLK